MGAERLRVCWEYPKCLATAQLLPWAPGYTDGEGHAAVQCEALGHRAALCSCWSPGLSHWACCPWAERHHGGSLEGCRMIPGKPNLC